MSGFLGGGPALFEIRDVAGYASDLLIRNRELGEALARAVGDGRVVLMRGHGCTVVADAARATNVEQPARPWNLWREQAREARARRAG